MKVPRPTDRYTWAWIGWIGVSAGGFALLEGYAIRHRKWDRTLSVHWRRVFGIHPRKPWHAAGRAITVVGLLWVAQHIAVGPEELVRYRRYLNYVEE